MTKAQCEKKLSELRTKHAKVKNDLDAAVVRELELNVKRESLAVDAAVGNAEAQATLKELNRERFDLMSYVEEHGIAIRKLEAETVKAAKEYDAAVFQLEKNDLIKLGQERIAIAKELDALLPKLNEIIEKSLSLSTDMTSRAYELGVSNLNSSTVNSRLNLQDVLSFALHGLFRELHLPMPDQRKPFSELEEFALERLKNTLNGLQERKAA